MDQSACACKSRSDRFVFIAVALISLDSHDLHVNPKIIVAYFMQC